MTELDDRRLSKLLWDARELAEMYGDLIRSSYRGAPAANYGYSVRDMIDAYRAERGWSPDGFGGELLGDARGPGGRRDLDDPDVIGVEAGGKLYHPTDVTVVRVTRPPDR